MRYIFVLNILLMITFGNLLSRELTLDYCTKQSLAKSPLQKSKLYYKTKSDLETESITTNYYSQLSLDGQATYQSDVVKFKLPFPGAVSPDISNEQYHIDLNFQQIIWDGGITASQKGIAEAGNKVKSLEVDVSLFKIKEMINELYFKILFLQSSVKTLEVNRKQLDTNRYIIKSLVDNGVMLKSNLENIDIQILSVQQKIDEAIANKKMLMSMLSEWIEEPIDENAVLIVPKIESAKYEKIYRPEYKMFSEQQNLLEQNKGLISSKLLPKFFVFGLAGVGAPNRFNMFENSASFYWMGGIKLQWLLFDWSGTSKKNESIEISKSIVNAQKENFDKNLKIALIQEKSDIKKYDDMMKTDLQMIKKQEIVMKEYFSKLKNGTVTITDYLLQVNSLLILNINYDLHKLKKISAQVNLLTKTGNI